MTRGSNRHDVPLTARTEWISYDCPSETWEYWESEVRFAETFPQRFRIEIALTMTDLRNYRIAYNQPAEWSSGARLDPKKIKRELKKAVKCGAYVNSAVEYFVEIHSTDLPNATVAEKAQYVLDGFIEAPEDFLLERAKPEPLFTRVFFELFHRHGLNVSLGSADMLYGNPGLSEEARAKQAPETPFVEFVRRCVWQEHNSSAKFCARVRKIVQRCPVCSKL